MYAKRRPHRASSKVLITDDVSYGELAPRRVQTKRLQRSASWTWEVLESPEAAEAIAPAWDALAMESPLSSFAGAGFALSYWAGFLDRLNRPAVHILRRDGQLMAVLPLRSCGRVVRTWAPFVNAHTPWTFAMQPDPPELHARILDHLLTSADRIHLSCLHLGAPHWQALYETASALGLLASLRPTADGDTFLDLPPSLSAFEDSIPKKLRVNIWKQLEKLKRMGTLDFQRITGDPDLGVTLEECFDVETLGWKNMTGSPIKRDPRTYRFYTELARRMSVLGRLALYMLKLNGKVVAFRYCLRSGGRLDSLKTSYDPAWARYSPGILTQFLMARTEIEDGEVGRMHFGYPTPHKLRWATGVTPLATLDVYSRGLRGRLGYCGPALRSVLEDGVPASVAASLRRAASRVKNGRHRIRVLIGKRLSREHRR